MRLCFCVVTTHEGEIVDCVVATVAEGTEFPTRRYSTSEFRKIDVYVDSPDDKYGEILRKWDSQKSSEETNQLVNAIFDAALRAGWKARGVFHNIRD